MRHSGDLDVCAADRHIRFVLLVPRDAREHVFVEYDIPGDDDLARLRIVALVALVTVRKPEVDALLCVPATLLAMFLVDIHIGEASEHPKHAEVGLLPIERFIGSYALDRSRRCGV